MKKITLHRDHWHGETLVPAGTAHEVEDALAADLEARGLTTEVSAVERKDKETPTQRKDVQGPPERKSGKAKAE